MKCLHWRTDINESHAAFRLRSETGGICMGNKLVWHDRFNIGVDSIDREHKKLFSIINKLLNLSENGTKRTWICQEGIKYFKDHTIRHFADEEAYMRMIDFPGYNTHKRLHDNFRRNVLPVLERELVSSGYSSEAVRHFLGVCIGWLTGHTLTEDRAITGKAPNKWGELRPEEEMNALEETIIRHVNGMFKLNTEIISEYYRGEDFGNAICWRMGYRSRQKERWYVTMVFEEKLLINTVGTVLGIKFHRVDDMVINATRYIARQFLEGIRESFPTMDLCKVEEENLLTREQLLDSFEKGYPQFSLLFDTGAGYFAFCVDSPEKFEGNLGRTITGENAMGEIKEYLEDVAPKKRILVVDDSSVMRLTLKKLLEDDYQLELAPSAVSAFKSIALEMPDLILLDYAMPVCDGRQTLEMIRSEEEYADIPVMFLTGKSDVDSITKVMSLNPVDYILKTTKPKDIRVKIDKFFA